MQACRARSADAGYGKRAGGSATSGAPAFGFERLLRTKEQTMADNNTNDKSGKKIDYDSRRPIAPVFRGVDLNAGYFQRTPELGRGQGAVLHHRHPAAEHPRACCMGHAQRLSPSRTIHASARARMQGLPRAGSWYRPRRHPDADQGGTRSYDQGISRLEIGREAFIEAL